MIFLPSGWTCQKHSHNHSYHDHCEEHRAHLFGHTAKFSQRAVVREHLGDRVPVWKRPISLRFQHSYAPSPYSGLRHGDTTTGNPYRDLQYNTSHAENPHTASRKRRQFNFKSDFHPDIPSYQICNSNKNPATNGPVPVYSEQNAKGIQQQT